MSTTITVKNIPTQVYERLKDSARANRRSINSEIITIIEAALQSKPVEPGVFLARARQLREKTAAYKITDDELNAAKDAGRG